MVMYDRTLHREAQDYARAEPGRAALALSEAGFGEFKFGMSLKEFNRKVRQPPSMSDAGVGQKEAEIAGVEAHPSRQDIGLDKRLPLAKLAGC
jgi:hypothetical protein